MPFLMNQNVLTLLEECKNTTKDRFRLSTGVHSTVGDLLNEWLKTLSHRTRINYQSGARMLTIVGLINLTMSSQEFSRVNHDEVLDKIKQIRAWRETTRQARAALYISFTRYLSRLFPGVFKKAVACREGTNKTFFRVHEKVVSKAMSRTQWLLFLAELRMINPRDCLIAKLTLQGGKRIREVLALAVEAINWETMEITFSQSKTRGMQKETVITYPASVMHELRVYIGDRRGRVFVSRTGNSISLNQVANTFSRAGTSARIPFKVTPHILRTSAVTYFRQQGFSDSDIQKVTGHASTAMVNAYDKSDRANNASKKVNLLGETANETCRFPLFQKKINISLA